MLRWVWSLLLVPALTIAPVGGIAAPDSAPTAAQRARSAYSAMSTAQRLGQLFMLGVPSTGAPRAQLAALEKGAAGSVFLTGTTMQGAARTARVTAALTKALTVKGARPFIATDQEGGLVQRLKGAGFSAIPTALTQGASAPAALEKNAATWGRQLRAAGVNVDLAPVADVVPAATGVKNAPIGSLQREFGYTTPSVAPHVAAFAAGVRSAGVQATLKHFPGIGHASGNSDTTAVTTAPVTRHDTRLAAFARGISAGAQFVMVASTQYPKIQAGVPACFSKTIVTGILRGDLRFAGIIVSDSFDAAAISGVPVAQRAVRFLEAGGTLVLDAHAAHLAAMEQGVAAQMKKSARFAALVTKAVLLVLTEKARDGLL